MRRATLRRCTVPPAGLSRPAGLSGSPRLASVVLAGVLMGALAGLLPGRAAAAGADAAAAATPAPLDLADAFTRYKLAAGDVITIRVLGEDEFKLEKVRLNDLGSISFPAIGEIKVLGKTVGELETIIVDGLKGRILVNPKVSVQIDEYRPFFVNGMVERPGGYPFQIGLTVRKAASIAGGFRERASTSKIFVIRESDATQKPQKADLNTLIGPGDIITVEESFF